MWSSPVILTETENDQDFANHIISQYDVMTPCIMMLHHIDVTYIETDVCRQHYSMNNRLIHHCNNLPP